MAGDDIKDATLDIRDSQQEMKMIGMSASMS